MLDDEARRALEQEAIALVNLSNSQPLAGKRRSAAVAVAAPKQWPQPQPHGPHGHASIPGVHPLLLQNKAALMARRDDRQAPHPHRAVNSSTSALPIYARPPGAVDDRRLSMSVFVDADGTLRGPASAAGGKSACHPYAALELSPIEPTTPSLKTEDKSASPTSTTTTTLAALPHHHHLHADAHISMQSLLVNLKKRKPEDEPTAAAPTKLPRFRDVFEPARPEPRPSPMPALKMQATPTVSYAAAEPASPPPSASQKEAPAMVEDSPYPPPPELKCKYRTGKCGNQRALKSCGDYHNLCNYHRLRANANQRKLDRKKKVQRGHPTGISSSSNGNSNGNGSSSEATSPVAAPKLLAASTLASLPSSFLLPRAAQQSSQAPSHPLATAPFLTYLVPPPSSSLLGSKPETKSC